VGGHALALARGLAGGHGVREQLSGVDLQALTRVIDETVALMSDKA